MESLNIQKLVLLVDQGKITTNQARKALGLSEIEGGDTPFILKNLLAGDFLEKSISKPISEPLVQASTQDLRRREIEKRIAVALLDFVEKVSSGKSSTGKNCPARDEEIAVLPAVAKILLEVSQRLPR